MTRAPCGDACVAANKCREGVCHYPDTPTPKQTHPSIPEFEAWLRTVCFQKPTPEAHDLAKDAWRQSRGEWRMEKRALRRQMQDVYLALSTLYTEVQHLPADDQYGRALRLAADTLQAYSNVMDTIEPDAKQLAEALLKASENYVREHTTLSAPYGGGS